MRRSTTAADLERAAQKKKAIILAVLVSTLGIIWLMNLLKGEPAPAAASPSTTPSQPAVSTPATHSPSQVRADIVVNWPVVSTRNPFAFDDRGYEKKDVTKTTFVKKNFNLQGTLVGDDPRAFINGKSLRIGDSIHGAVLKRIGHGHVILEIDGVDVVVGR